MKRSKQEDFLREILADEALEATREDSLARGLVVLHARRQARIIRSAVVAGVPLLILAALLLRPEAKVLPAAASHTAVASASVSSIKIYPAIVASHTPPIPIISDEELLALFKDQSVGLLGTAGQQKLVVFASPKVAMQ